MKKVIIFASLLYAVSLNAQIYKPLLTEGKKWECVRTNVSPMHKEGITKTTVTVEGDTLVNETHCKRLHVVYHDYFGDNDTHDYMAAYEDNGKLYAFLYGNEKDASLLIDFNMHKGDKFTGQEDTQVEVLEEDSIEAFGEKYRRMQVCVNGWYGYWVEGIGVYPDFSMVMTPVISPLGEYMFLDYCYDNDKMVFTKNSFLSPSTVGINATVAAEDNNGKTYNLNGSLINNTNPKGVFIKGGKKYMRLK